jgi:disulfide bond formation protein DsbB
MRKNGLLLSFIVALVATTSSLFYSEIAGFVPCTLCWYQRILMYPLIILLGIAFERKDRNIIPYVLTMTGIGSSISLYHYYIQLSPAGAFVPCSAVGISVSCTSREFTHLGYITIPMMAATAFLLIFGILWVTRYAKNSK